MAFQTPATVVTGDVIAAAYGNSYVRDNWQASTNALALAVGDVFYATALNTLGRIPIGAGGLPLISNGTTPAWGQTATAGIADNAVTTAKIADSQVTSAKIADGTIATADLANGAVTAPKTYPDVMTGFIGSGVWQYAYNGDGTIASQVMSGGSFNTWAVTYEYSGGRLSVMRLRIGGAAGSIQRSIIYDYNSNGTINVETHT